MNETVYFTRDEISELRKSMSAGDIKLVKNVLVIRKNGKKTPKFSNEEIRKLLAYAIAKHSDIESIIVITDEKEISLVIPQKVYFLKFLRLLDNISTAFTLAYLFDRSSEKERTRLSHAKYILERHLNLSQKLVESEVVTFIEEKTTLTDILENLRQAKKYLTDNDFNRCLKHLQISRNILQVRLITKSFINI